MDKIEGKPFGQPANDIEKQWLLDRLKTLSAREAYQLAAMMLTTGRLREVSGKEGDELLLAVLKLDRKETTEAINCLLSLSDYQVLCPAGGYEKLGEYYLRYEAEMPEAVLPYANLQQIGFRYEELHPGVFIGDCFVVLPGREPKQTYDGTNLDKVQETDWSLRLRLAAPAVPKGAWACLPDHAFAEPDGRLGEIALALRELKAETIQECELLEVRCSLPGITILQDEYDDLNDLIRDGNDLGFLLEEQGQGMPDFMENSRLHWSMRTATGSRRHWTSLRICIAMISCERTMWELSESGSWRSEEGSRTPSCGTVWIQLDSEKPFWNSRDTGSMYRRPPTSGEMTGSSSICGHPRRPGRIGI